MTVSEQKQLRSLMLNIATNTITRLAGGNTKYINQRDEKFLLASYYNENYNRKFRDALKNYVTDKTDRAKYPNYNDKVYKVIFRENAADYKRLLELSKNDKVREKRFMPKYYLPFPVLKTRWQRELKKKKFAIRQNIDS